MTSGSEMSARQAAALDVAAIRRDCPLHRQTVHGRPLVYLDNAATTQKPQVVIDRLTRYYAEENANVHRGVHWLSERATESCEEVRSTVARKTTADVDALLERIQRMVTAPVDAPIDDTGPQSALAAVRRFPARVTCATLPWQTLRAAAAKGDAVVSTG